MGQKVSPHGLRVGIIKDWESKWYADKKNFADFLAEDKKVREYVKKKLYVAGVSKVLIERAAENKIRVTVLTAKPGMVIGKGGSEIEKLRPQKGHRQAHRQGSGDFHRRNKKVGAGCAAHRRERSSGPGKTCFFQESHEAGHRQDHEIRGQGYQDYRFRKTGRS